MHIPITQVEVSNFNDEVNGPYLAFEFPEEMAKDVERREESRPKPVFSDGRVKNSRAAYSDENCEIISNRVGNRILLYKTLSKADKVQFYAETTVSAIRKDSEKVCDTRLEHAVFNADDMYPLTSALQTLGLSCEPELMANLAIKIVASARTGRKTSFIPHAFGANHFRA